ncbi:MAG: peptide-methionine (S)-S-oxide reductase, partial [Sphingomonadales bacterium]|nr:peptide-methionine (S)-S-oxide reductase [Sphingomonadales bacterium]
GDTGHAEAVRIVYDPRIVSYGTLLRIYFSVVTDPTTLNRQGPDRGSQYRSAIVPTTKAQARVARAYIAQLGKGGYYDGGIVTRIEANKGFHPAEAYHQNFMEKHPRHGYIVRWDAPKLANFKATYPRLYKAKAAP